MTKFSVGAIKEVQAVTNKHRKIADRESELTELGYLVEEHAMGSSGKGSIKFLDDQVRIQIGYGHGRHNYAKCVSIPHDSKEESKKIYENYLNSLKS